MTAGAIILHNEYHKTDFARRGSGEGKPPRSLPVRYGLFVMNTVDEINQA